MAEEFDNIVSIIRYFIKTQRYGPVDRMSYAMSPESVTIALYDMLRTVDSLFARSIVVELHSDDKIYTVRCCEYDEDERLGYGIKGVAETIKAAPEDVKDKLKGKEIQCVPCPHRPSQEEIKQFLEKVEKDPSYARKIVLEAFATHKSEV